MQQSNAKPMQNVALVVCTCMYMLTWVVEYPKEVILFSGSKQLYFIFQWIRRSVFLEPF